MWCPLCVCVWRGPVWWSVCVGGVSGVLCGGGVRVHLQQHPVCQCVCAEAGFSVAVCVCRERMDMVVVADCV